MAPHQIDDRDRLRPHQAFGHLIHAARTSRALTRAELATRADVSYSMLANIEAGRRRASNAILSRLALALDLYPDRLTELRDALEADVNIEPGTGLDGYLRGELDALPGLPSTAGHTGSSLSAVVDELWAEHHYAQALVEATSNNRSSRSPRQHTISSIIRDLGALDDESLTKAQGYVAGLRAAQDQLSTAVDPTLEQPLVRVPDSPFGPLKTWSAPAWIRDLQPAHITDTLTVITPGPKPSTRGSRPRPMLPLVGQPQLLRSILVALDSLDDAPTESWPSTDTLVRSLQMGRRLSKYGPSGVPGFVTPQAWLRFVDYQHPPLDSSRNTVLCQWLTRIAFIGSALSPNVADLASFTAECLRYAPDLLLVDPPETLLPASPKPSSSRATTSGKPELRRIPRLKPKDNTQ